MLGLVEEVNKEFLCTLYCIKPRGEFEAYCDWSDVEGAKETIESALRMSRGTKKRLFKNFA